MNDQRLEELLLAWEDNSLTAEELGELKQLLAADPQARQRLVAAGILRSVAETRTKAWESMAPALSATVGRYRKTSRFAWWQWRPLSAAAAVGLVIGLFSASMVWAYVGPYGSKLTALLQESFESGSPETKPGLPQEAGFWSGDLAKVATADQDLIPRSGTKMLRFVSATYEGENAKHSAWSDVYRLVDVRGRVESTKSVVRLSASFAAMPYPADEQYLSSLELCALEGDLDAAPQPLSLPWWRENSAATALRKMPLPGNKQWQRATVEVAVSPQTRFVLVHLAVLRTKPFPPTEPVHFGGHYVDNVKLELVTAPATAP